MPVVASVGNAAGGCGARSASDFRTATGVVGTGSSVSSPISARGPRRARSRRRAATPRRRRVVIVVANPWSPPSSEYVVHSDADRAVQPTGSPSVAFCVDVLLDRQVDVLVALVDADVLVVVGEQRQAPGGALARLDVEAGDHPAVGQLGRVGDLSPLALEGGDGGQVVDRLRLELGVSRNVSRNTTTPRTTTTATIIDPIRPPVVRW